MSDHKPALDLDLSRPSPGRVYDYWLGGSHNYAVDREFAERQLARAPEIREAVRENRAFLRRAVRFAAASGIRQFVDIGSGLPTQGNVHEIADEVDPGAATVVYIDNEPVASAHARILLEDTADPARHRALAGDFFDGPALWERVRAEGLDPREPICLLTVALLHLLPSERQPESVLAFYRDQLAPGSLLVLSHACLDTGDEAAARTFGRISDDYRTKTAVRGSGGLRNRQEIAEFFGDFELLDPGLVWLPQWRPDTTFVGDPARTRAVAGVARKNPV
ncbi:SAM-dependent methyltransferase [Saccharomonospora xinjiangensis]|uniref:O-methyltransferase involved in polyketide biosynthesis n=1 Tax=Saccharomonospora xinjiangensis XJ-54 TaxID=882086 RepID=I0UYW7_9PSEU|nr:SAM-dependent methyltransferase [Saccharomonospora xinjiangensis]EID53070.1 O-methyltransferase involved in polyketide biosynthesis [Saccharomonospora xinjiangensis XJ-54]